MMVLHTKFSIVQQQHFCTVNMKVIFQIIPNSSLQPFFEDSYLHPTQCDQTSTTGHSGENERVQGQAVGTKFNIVQQQHFCTVEKSL